MSTTDEKLRARLAELEADPEREARQDFTTWCHEYRLLGRDRLWPAYRAGWIAGYGTAKDEVSE